MSRDMAADIVWPILERYAVTTKGPNPWTPEAILEALRIRVWVEKALKICDGTINSMFRTATVNRAVGGSEKSRHMEGLAVDIKPSQLYTPATAAKMLWVAGQAKALGDVHQVIQEPSWVHISWQRVGEGASPAFLRSDGKKYFRIA